MDIIFPMHQRQYYMEKMDQNQFYSTPRNNISRRALQRNTVARQNQAISNGETQRKQHLSTYSDTEKRWLVEADEEERMRGKRCMERLKREMRSTVS